jgi:uncharacterized membrane protein
MRTTTKKLVLNSLMIALVFVITYLPFLHIPSPIAGGYYNVGDAAVMIAAILLGRKSGFIAGAIGSALADIATLSFIYAPATLVIKGIEGCIIGAIARRKSDDGAGEPSRVRQILAVSAGAIEMVLGYFIYQVAILMRLDPKLGMASIIADLPGNFVQGGVSAVLALIFVALIYRTNVPKLLK